MIMLHISHFITWNMEHLRDLFLALYFALYLLHLLAKPYAVLRANHTEKPHRRRGCSKNTLEAHLKENTGGTNVLSIYAIILLFLLLYPQQPNMKDVVSSKAHFLLDLTDCFSQKWHWRAMQLCAMSWEVEIILLL